MIRVGLIGAGKNMCLRHLPGLRSQADVEIVAVANRSVSSAERVAKEFEIPKVCNHWKELLELPHLDAVVIGTWPDTHAEITLAAHQQNKHVLCEARLARNLEECQQMVDSALQHAKLVSMLVPSPYGLASHKQIMSLLNGGYIGELRELVVLAADDQFHDYSLPLHWRQNAVISGKNIMSLGIMHETARRWVPPTLQVMAQAQTFEKVRPHPVEHGNTQVTVPDSVQVLSQLQGGGRGMYHCSGITLMGPGKQIHLYGALGTLKIIFGTEETVWGGRTGDEELMRINSPPEKQCKWRVEEEFIAAIRGEEEVQLNTFAIGLEDMRFTEAVHQSIQEQRAIDISSL